MKRYKLSDFDKEDVENAKSYLKKAFYGYLEVCLDEKINEAFHALSQTSFSSKDTITFSFSVDTIGNDILSALGCSIINKKTETLG